MRTAILCIALFIALIILCFSPGMIEQAFEPPKYEITIIEDFNGWQQVCVFVDNDTNNYREAYPKAVVIIKEIKP